MQEKILGWRNQCQDFGSVSLLYRAGKRSLCGIFARDDKGVWLNFTQDDAHVWERLHGNGGPKRVFGIGSSD
ncbi:hypothetical protein E3N88_02352 [Mikania micrantha]|uniref:Uncharacterized protein n=1 Tax=Mikania micrantha TaxID=192012 RepID=A0A5N6Q557_9ASTR|nr:hypothetical protein E3N88_02352 [Mikania micrantha]